MDIAYETQKKISYNNIFFYILKKGKIDAVSILVGGKVSGTINAKEKLILSAKGNIEGDVFTKILVVEEGAKFNGKSKVG